MALTLQVEAEFLECPTQSRLHRAFSRFDHVSNLSNGLIFKESETDDRLVDRLHGLYRVLDQCIGKVGVDVCSFFMRRNGNVTQFWELLNTRECVFLLLSEIHIQFICGDAVQPGDERFVRLWGVLVNVRECFEVGFGGQVLGKSIVTTTMDNVLENLGIGGVVEGQKRLAVGTDGLG